MTLFNYGELVRTCGLINREVFSLTEKINELLTKEEHWEQYMDIKGQFIHSIAKNMSLYGITPSVGRLYGTLYFSDNPLTLDEMGKELSMSKTSMSTGVRALLDMNMVEPVFRRGVRKDLYRTEDDWYKSFTALFSRQWRKAAEMNIEEADEALHALEKVYKDLENETFMEKIKKDMDKIVYAKNYYEWLLQFIEIVESGKIFDIIPKSEN